MAKYLVTRGTTLHGKALNEGDVVELDSGQAAQLHQDVVPAPEPEPVKESEPKPSKKK